MGTPQGIALIVIAFLVGMVVGYIISWGVFSLNVIAKRSDNLWRGYYKESEEKHNIMLEEKEKKNDTISDI